MNVEERFYQAIAKEQYKATGIHVSSLSYECMRKAKYSITHDMEQMNAKTLITLWIGSKLHETPLTSGHEMKLSWNGIVGTCDEYEAGTLIDKKTCTKIPEYPQKQHVKQIEYYAYMLKQSGKPVHKAYVLYIDIVAKAVRSYEIKLRSDNIIRNEMLMKKKVIEKALEEATLPDRRLTWLCSYCPFARHCFTDQV